MTVATASVLSTRILPRDEWWRLTATGLDPDSLPESAQVAVVEQDGEIVGRVAGMVYLHAEVIWLAPEHRKRVGAWRWLIRGFWSIADSLGAHGAWAAALSPEMQHVLERLHAQPLPGDHFIIPRGT